MSVCPKRMAMAQVVSERTRQPRSRSPMEQGPKLFCPQCGAQAIAAAAFCHRCGCSVADLTLSACPPPPPTLVVEPPTPTTSPPVDAPSYRGLKAMNWVLVALLAPGAAFTLLRASSPVGVLRVGTLMAFLLGTFLLTAVTLSRDTVFLLGSLSAHTGPPCARSVLLATRQC